MQEVHLSKINLKIEKVFTIDVKVYGMTLIYTFDNQKSLAVLSYDKTNKFIIDSKTLYLISDGEKLLAIQNEDKEICFIRHGVDLAINNFGNNLYLYRDTNIKYINSKGYSLMEFLLELEEAIGENNNLLLRI